MYMLAIFDRLLWKFEKRYKMLPVMTYTDFYGLKMSKCDGKADEHFREDENLCYLLARTVALVIPQDRNSM